MLLVHRAVNCRGPVYLRDLICIYTPTRALRSEGTKQLKRPKTKCKAGDASFPAAAPDLWNRLQFSLRELCNENSFKNALKTLYFKQYFECLQWLSHECLQWFSRECLQWLSHECLQWLSLECLLWLSHECCNGWVKSVCNGWVVSVCYGWVVCVCNGWVISAMVESWVLAMAEG